MLDWIREVGLIIWDVIGPLLIVLVLLKLIVAACLLLDS